LSQSLDELFAKLEKVFSKKKHLYIFLHDNPDPDAIASGWAFQYLVKKKFNINSTIVYGGIIARAENRTMVKLLKIPLVPFSQVKCTLRCSYALLDTQPNLGNNSLPDKIVPQIVIDHHPLINELSSDFCFVRTEIGATATILFEFMKYAGLDISTNLATALYYALSSETQDLGREANERDIKAYLDLFPKTNKKILSKIVHPKNSPKFLCFLAKGLNNACLRDHIAYSHLGVVPYPDYVHQIADLLLSCENIRWSLCTGWVEKTLYLSLRATNSRAKAGILVRKLVGKKGKAGGHDTMAGGKLSFSIDIDNSIRERVEQTINKRFLRYCNRGQTPTIKKFTEYEV